MKVVHRGSTMAVPGAKGFSKLKSKSVYSFPESFNIITINRMSVWFFWLQRTLRNCVRRFREKVSKHFSVCQLRLTGLWGFKKVPSNNIQLKHCHFTDFSFKRCLGLVLQDPCAAQFNCYSDILQ